MIKILRISVPIHDSVGFFKRFIAQIIDFLVSLLIYILLYSLLNQILNLLKSDIIFDIIHVIIVYLIFFYSYCVLFDFSPLKGTIGKFLLGIQVVNFQEKKISFSQSLIRNIAKYLSLILFFSGFIYILISKDKISFHDILSKTLVIKKKR